MAKMIAGYAHSRGQAKDAGAIRAFSRAAYADWAAHLGREPLPMSADYEAALKVHRFDLLYEGEPDN